MRLITEQGELTLPEDFSFEVEQNSAFFSENGAATVGATIPATGEDLARLGFPTRVARSTKHINTFPAILQHGIYQKKGILAVASASSNGISCSLGLEDSTFYAEWKNSNLKDLFSAKNYSEFYDGNITNWIDKVYTGSYQSDLWRLIPVAVNHNDSDGSYQINNEPEYDANDGIWPLVHNSRVVKEGDDNVSVPFGYGIAPFLNLYSFFQIMFELCGFTVTKNCFKDNKALSGLILLHNCSDVLCNGRINFSDLVPNKTISEILSWMQDKFHAQVIIHPSVKTVEIVLMEDILNSGFDNDLSKLVIGDLDYIFCSSSRVVLSSDTSLSGAAPVADTPEAMLDKYQACSLMSECDWFYKRPMGLVLRLSTGTFYEMRHSHQSIRGNDVKNVAVGSNYFKYDRRNSDESEDFAPEDLLPPMVFVNGILMPYIGDRIHRNTTYNDSKKDEEQEIIIVDYAGLSKKVDYTASGSSGGRVPSDVEGGHYYYGTTQKYDNIGELRSDKIELTSIGLFYTFFRQYNKHLRNNSVKIEGQFDLTQAELINFQMYVLKQLNGQRLLPEQLRYQIGNPTKCLKASFRLIKDFADAVDDEVLTYPEPLYKWVLETDHAAIKARELQGDSSGGSHNPGAGSSTSRTVTYSPTSGSDTFLVSPNKAGQRLVLNVEYQFKATVRQNGTVTTTDLGTYTFEEIYNSVEI